MNFLDIMPHLYALILTLMHPWEVNALRKRLDELEGETKPSTDWIENAIFDDTMGDFWKAPLLALIPTVAQTLEKQNTLLSGITVFLFVILFSTFYIIKANWNPWDLNRGRKIIFWEIQGRYLILAAKIFLIFLASIIVLIA